MGSKAKLYQRRQELNEASRNLSCMMALLMLMAIFTSVMLWNKISKDIIVRSKSMAGYYAPYSWMGFYGLRLSRYWQKQGVKRKEIDLVEYSSTCVPDYALSQVEKQKEDFKRLGVSGDWDNPYVTLTPDYEAAQIRVFGEMAKRLYLPWC